MTSQALPYRGTPESPSDRAGIAGNRHATAIECNHPGFQRFDLPNGVSINVPVQSFPCTYEAVASLSARDEIISRVVDAIWTELERQAERFGCVDRERSLIDIGAIELDMAKVAAAALKSIECDQVDNVARRYMDEIGWW